jgi:ubiquinone/menaquinone biosynthesis C-methylase UbiE
MTPNDINNLSYTDFIGLINQWNVLPGAFTTLSKWIAFSHINSKSHILEVACTTGFSSMGITEFTGCSGIGIDISKSSIVQAIYNQKHYLGTERIKYKCADGYKFKSNEKFTHVVFGASLRFFPDPDKMLKKSLSLLTDPGFILSSEFFVNKKIPTYLVKRAKDIFDINVTQVGYKEVMKIYEGLEVVYEDKNKLIPETDEELKHYCKSTVDRAVKRLKLNDDKVYKTIFNRLYVIKEMSNLLRPYQNYNVLVLRYKKDIYPNRYIELF